MLKRVFAALSLITFTCGVAAADDIALAHRRDNAEADAVEIISMRSALAKEFIKPGAEVNEETFKKVCGEVGKKVKEISEREGVVIRHSAVKSRNPKNSATPEEAVLMERFEKEKKLKGIDEEAFFDGKKYFRVTRPIYVEKACLACHGDKDSRPLFIKEKYPEDRAYGFKTGDLRGLISILIPLD
ncbi:MAG: DUF3365 domain-containing protein [Deltaproteobacteria bacterium]|nr:DUF3365 domain-containing protein [Deltaproteobacteria bacterium]